MMGYAHSAAGISGSLALAAYLGYVSPEAYLLAAVAGALGGIAPDIDVKDQEEGAEVTDGSRPRLAVIGLIAIGLIEDRALNYGILATVTQTPRTALFGLIIFVILLLVGHCTAHRTFAHSLLFAVLTAGCIFAICPSMVAYYLVGFLLHLILDMLNNEYNHHGIWLLYPIKSGDGIALGLCRAGRTGNKVFYFIGIGMFIAFSALYITKFNSINDTVPLFVILAYVLVSFHFVRTQSESEQRHIMHINGEL